MSQRSALNYLQGRVTLFALRRLLFFSKVLYWDGNMILQLVSVPIPLWLIASWLIQDGLKWFLVQLAHCQPPHYNCQPPMLHIKNPSPCLRNFSSLTRQQPITIFSSVNTLSITVFSSWKLQFLLLSSLSQCLPSGVPLRSSYVLRLISLVRLFFFFILSLALPLTCIASE